MLSLKSILFVNGLSSAATGALLVLFSGPVAELFGVKTRAPFTETGIFLLLFGSYVLWAATRPAISARALSAIIVLDVAWVLASGITLLAAAPVMSLTGELLILAVAAWVGLMAFLQHKGRGAALHGSQRVA